MEMHRGESPTLPLLLHPLADTCPPNTEKINSRRTKNSLRIWVTGMSEWLNLFEEISIWSFLQPGYYRTEKFLDRN